MNEAGAAVSTYGDAVVSPDGTKVAFVSPDNGFGPTDTNGVADVYVRDLATGTTELVSANAASSDGGNNASGDNTYAFTPDGDSIVFQSDATNLVTTPTVTTLDNLYLRDLASDTTTLMTPNVYGTDGAGGSYAPVVSPDGTKLAFASTASDLTSLPTAYDVGQVYVRDIVAGTITMVSVNAASNGGGGNHSLSPSFNPDGTAIAFASLAPDLGPPDSDDWESSSGLDIFIRDLATGTTTMVTTNPDGTDSANSWSERPSFSPDGSKVLFMSQASDLGPVDGNGEFDVYLYDVALDTIDLVSVNAAGTAAGNGYSAYPSFSPDGSRVLFRSSANDLGPTDNTRPPTPFYNRDEDVYVRDLATDAVTLVSVNVSDQNSGNAESTAATFAPDGDKIAFVSSASDLGATDSNETGDVYVRSLSSGITWLVSGIPGGTDSGNGHSWSPTIVPPGDRIAFSSYASNLAPNARPGYQNLYVATLHGADVAVAVSDVPDPVSPGVRLSYVAEVNNRGPDTAEQVGYVLLLPEGTSFASADPTAGSCAPPTPEQPRVVECSLGDLAEGDTATVTVDVDLVPNAGGQLSALALVTSNTVDPDGRSNTATVDTTVEGP